MPESSLRIQTVVRGQAKLCVKVEERVLWLEMSGPKNWNLYTIVKPKRLLTLHMFGTIILNSVCARAYL